MLTFNGKGLRRKLHYLWFCFWVTKKLFHWKPSWIYASDPLSCPLTLWLNRLTGIRIVYQEHDSPDTTLDRLISKSRAKIAGRAQFCVFPNRSRAESFRDQTNCDRPMFHVWNCPCLEEVGGARTPTNGSPIFVYYHGNLSPNQLSFSVLEAIGLLKGKARLKIIGYETESSQGYISNFKKKAEELQIEYFVELLGARPRHKLWVEMKQCDIGLALMPKQSKNFNIEHMVGASNKSFDYLAEGLALLVSNHPDWEKTYVEPGYGLACDPEDPESIAEALQWFLNHPKEMREMGERGRRRVLSDWNYEFQFQPALNLLNGNHK